MNDTPTTDLLEKDISGRAVVDSDECRKIERELNRVSGLHDELITENKALEELAQNMADYLQADESEMATELKNRYHEITHPAQTEIDWPKAKEHFDDIRKQYQDLEGMPGVNTSLDLRVTFDPLAVRYNSGERTKELYEAMMEVC